MHFLIQVSRLAMKPVAKILTIGALSLGFVALPAQASTIVGSAEAGAKKNSMCIGCHGIPEYKTAFPVLYRVPKIAGQSEAYMVSALKAYKSGERSHPSMKAVSASLSDQDMADLAAFYAKPRK
jgi:cytochrome c553